MSGVGACVASCRCRSGSPGVKPVDLNGQYLRKTDSRPFFGGAGPRETDVDMVPGELTWAPQGPTGRWFVNELHNGVRSDAAVFRVRQSWCDHGVLMARTIAKG